MEIKLNQKLSFVKSRKFQAGVIAVLAIAAVFYFFDIDLGIKPREKAPNLPVASASATEIHTTCEAKPAPSEIFDCYVENFNVYMRAMEPNGGRATLELLQALNDLGGYAQSNCHPLSHKVGNIALHVYGTVPNAVPQYIPTCHSGYYHGLLEEYLATASSYEQGVKEVCGTTETQIYFNWFQCMHGLGHGVMQFRDNELPQALKDCDLVGEADQANEICYAGSFMENITTDEKTGHPAKYIRVEDPLYPCNGSEFEDKYRPACYFLASSQILKVNGYDMQDAFVQCARVEDEYRWLCFQSLGRDVSGSSLRNQETVIDQCQWAKNEDDNGNCFYGAVRDFINEKGEFEGGIALCKIVPDTYKQRCFDGVYLDLSLYKTGQDFLNVCATMPEPYSTQCRGYEP